MGFSGSNSPTSPSCKTLIKISKAENNIKILRGCFPFAEAPPQYFDFPKYFKTEAGTSFRHSSFDI